MLKRFLEGPIILRSFLVELNIFFELFIELFFKFLKVFRVDTLEFQLLKVFLIDNFPVFMF